MVRTVLRLEIRGRVQGAGYRWSMVEQARRLDLCGWVRNRRNGSVVAMVAGAPDAVDQMVSWARQGPRTAVVDAVEVFADDGSFEAFEQRPSA